MEKINPTKLVPVQSNQALFISNNPLSLEDSSTIDMCAYAT